MNKIALSAAALALMAVGARADYTFTFPSTLAADSAATNALIPCQSFSDDATTTDISIKAAGVLHLSVSWGAVADYKANAGLLLPFNNLWTAVDFSNVTAVSFFYKTYDAKTAVEFTPNSDLYTGAANNDGVMMLAALTASAAGKTATVSLPDGIGFLAWMTDQAPSETNQSWDEVKTAVKLLQFAPKPVNSSTGLSTKYDTWLEISKVTLVGSVTITGNVNWVSSLGSACSGTSTVISDFASASPNKNTQGGYWFQFTDQNGTDSSMGVSTIADDANAISGVTYLDNADGSLATALAGISATLNKGDAKAHPYAGWADIGTGFKDADGNDTYLDLTGLKAISFYLSASDDFDVTNLTGVDLKIVNSSVSDAAQFNAGVDVSSFNNTTICFDVSQFTQPAWYKSTLTSMPLNDIGKLQWEIKINKDATLSASQSTFYIGDVTLWGTLPNAGIDGISSHKVGGKSALVANYSKGLVLSYNLDGASAAKIDVVRMDGSKVASFTGAAKASNQSFSVNLSRGTYLAVVKGGKTNLVAPFAVAK